MTPGIFLDGGSDCKADVCILIGLTGLDPFPNPGNG
jgi:hypothetical protein